MPRLTKMLIDLNMQGVLPRCGKAWTHSGVARLIACPALGGLVDVDGELHEAAFEGVVAPEDWRAARAAVRRRPRSEWSRPRDSLSLLGGILTCDEHGTTCFAGSTGPTRTYGSVVPGRCFVSMSRRAADAIVTNLVIERLRLPDAAELFRPHTNGDALDRQIAEHRQRREEIADLLAEGLLSAATARPRLAGIAEALGELESRRSPTLISAEDLVDPAAAWATWTTTQRREVIRILFSRLAIRHVGHKNGPRAVPSRLVPRWSAEPGAAVGENVTS